MNTSLAPSASNVPAVTFGFWITKIFANGLGETGASLAMIGVAEMMPRPWQTGANGHVITSGVFMALIAALVGAQICLARFQPWLFWAAIVCATISGAELADLINHSLGLGYPGASLLLLVTVLSSLFLWHRSGENLFLNSVVKPKVLIFYWVTIILSQTLGTALGDWLASLGPGYSGGAVVFGASCALLAALYFWTKLSRLALFWAAFILTRPLGESLGDFLYRPISQGGLQFSRPLSFGMLAVVVIALVLIVPQRRRQIPQSD